MNTVEDCAVISYGSVILNSTKAVHHVPNALVNSVQDYIPRGRLLSIHGKLPCHSMGQLTGAPQ